MITTNNPVSIHSYIVNNGYGDGHGIKTKDNVVDESEWPDTYPSLTQALVNKAEEEYVQVVVLDPYEFFDLFTVAEQDNIMTAGDGNKRLQKWLFRLMMNRGGIDKAHPKVIEGMAALVKAGLITQKRSDEILA